MAFFDFAETQYIKTVDTGEEIRVGSFKTAENLELQYMRPTIYITGTTLVTDERIRVNIYSERTYSAILYQSSWSNISEISGLMVKDRWIGWIRVDFNRENINKNITYYPTIELDNYTRDGQNFFIGFAHDFPFPIYDNGASLFYRHPLQAQYFGWV